jgi:hypothetical protein
VLSAGPRCWAGPPARTRRAAGTDLGEPGRVRRSQGDRSQAGRSQGHRSRRGHGKRRLGHTPRVGNRPPGHTDPPARRDHPPTHRDPPDRNPRASRTSPRCHTCRPGHTPGARLRTPAGRPVHGYWQVPAPHARDDPGPGLHASPAGSPGPADPGRPQDLAATPRLMDRPLPPRCRREDPPLPPRPHRADPPLPPRCRREDRPLPPRPSGSRHPASRSNRANRTDLTNRWRPTSPARPEQADRRHPAGPRDLPFLADPRHPARPRRTSPRRTSPRNLAWAANRHQTNPPGSAHLAGAADRTDPPRLASPGWRPVRMSRSRPTHPTNPAAPTHPTNPAAPTHRTRQPGPRMSERARPRSWPAGQPHHRCRTCRMSHPRRAHWLCRNARPGHSGSGRKDSAGRHRQARRGSRLADRQALRAWCLRPAWPARHTSVPGPGQKPRPLLAEMLAAGRASWARHPQRPARRRRTAGPDRRWPRSSPNRRSARRAVLAGSLARGHAPNSIFPRRTGHRLPSGTLSRGRDGGQARWPLPVLAGRQAGTAECEQIRPAPACGAYDGRTD